MLRPADKHKHIKLHARFRTIISEYDRNWLSPFLSNDLDISLWLKEKDELKLITFTKHFGLK